MRLAIVTVSLLLANAAMASDPVVSQKGFDASNSAEFAGYQSYSQNNYSDSDNYRINGVKCPVPTLVFGGNAQRSIYNHSTPENLGINIGVQIPLGTSRCEDAAAAELRKMQWALVDAEQLALQREEMHQLEKAKICALMLSKGFETDLDFCSIVEKIPTNAVLTDTLYKK